MHSLSFASGGDHCAASYLAGDHRCRWPAHRLAVRRDGARFRRHPRLRPVAVRGGLRGCRSGRS
jgi:hypothetical protein